MKTTASALLFLGLLVLLVAPPAQAAATYTFYVSGSSVGDTAPGVPRDYTVNLTNLNTTDSITFDLSISASPVGWAVQVSQNQLTVPASTTRQITLTVAPPTNALADPVGRYVNVTATPDDNTTAQFVSTTTRVTKVFGVAVTIIPQAGTSGDPGANVTWLSYIKNTGNSEQTYTVTTNNTTYTNTNLTTNLVTVSPGDTRVVQVWINISSTAQVGTLYSRIRAVSNENGSSQDAVEFAAGVNAKRAASLKGLTVDDLRMLSEPEAVVVFRNIIVANDGNVVDSYSLQGSANASRNGAWVSFDSPTIALSAFAQSFLNVTVTVPASANVIQDYTVEFRIISANSTNVIAFLNLTIQVIAKHDLRLVYDDLVTKQSGDPGSSVSFAVNVTNTGAFNQAVSMAYGGPNSAWVSISSTLFALGPNAWRIIYYNFSIPGAATPQTFDFQVMGSINWSNPYRNRTLDLQLEVRQVYDVTASSTITAGSGLPGATVWFNVSVRNNGTGTDNFTVSVSNATVGGVVGFSPASFMLSAGATQTVAITIDIASLPPPTAGVYYYGVTATSSGNVSRRATVNLALTIQQTYALSASVTPSSQAGDPGAAISFTLSVTNNGNGPDLVSLARLGTNQTWVTFSPGNATIGPGARVNFTVVVTAPTFAPTGDTDLSVRAVSGGDPNATAGATFTVSLNPSFSLSLTPVGGNVSNAHRNSSYSLSFILRNSGNQPDTYALTLGGSMSSWTSLPLDNVSLAPDSNMTITLVVLTPLVPANGNYDLTLTADSLGSSAPAITASLTLTVNDVFKPEVRLTITSFFATPGQTVNVPFSVRNNGTLRDIMSLIVTAHFPGGAVYYNNYTLNPGAQATGTFTFTASYAQTGTHTYLIDFLLTSGEDPATIGGGFANVTMEVRRVVSVSPINEQRSGGPTETIAFNLTVRNEGNITDTYFLDEILAGNSWLAAYSMSTITLAPNTSGNVTVWITLPSTVLTGTYPNTIRAQSENATLVRADAIFSILVSYGLEFSASGQEFQLFPGSTGYVNVTLNNTGSAADTFTLTASGQSGAWVSLSPSVISLGPSQFGVALVSVLVPPSEVEGSRTFRINAVSSSGQVSGNNQITFTITILPIYSFSAIGPDTPVPVVPGETATFTITVANTGSGADTYELIANPDQGVTFSPTQLAVPPHDSANVTVSFVPASGTVAGRYPINITILGAGGVPWVVNLNATVQQVHNITANAIGDTVITSAGPLGAVLNMTFEIANRGNAPDVANWTILGDITSWAIVPSGSLTLAAGASSSVTIAFRIPDNASLALAQVYGFEVQVVAAGQSVTTARVVQGALTVQEFAKLAIGLNPELDLDSAIVVVDRATVGALEYTVYVANQGNRVERVSILRQIPQGWSVLVNDVPQLTVDIAPNEVYQVNVRVSAFPTTATDDSIRIVARGASPLTDLVVTIGIDFVTGQAQIDANSITVSPLQTNSGGSVSVTVTVRNLGNGTVTGVQIELRKDGISVVDQQTIAAIPARGSVTVTLTWTTSNADGGAPHTLAVALPSTGDEVTAPGSVTVTVKDAGIIQKLTDTTTLGFAVSLLVVGLVLGLALRGGRKAPPMPAPPSPMSADAALAGLDELESAPPMDEMAPVDAGGDAPQAVEHKVVCPNCGTEQWIRGKEGQCSNPNCGVVIEVEEEEPAQGEPGPLDQ